MKIRPVKTEEDYEHALTRIDELWGAEVGTVEGNELDVLLTLVDAYEDKHHPVPPPTPIEAIKFVMDQKGLKQSDLVPYIGSRSKVSEVLNGKRPLTLSMIRGLKAGLKLPADILIQEDIQLPEGGDDVEWPKYPVKEILGRGLVQGFSPRTQAEEIVRSFASKVGITDLQPHSSAACFRQGSRLSHKDDPYAIKAWILQVLFEAQKVELSAKYEPKACDQSLLRMIAQLSVLSDGPLKAKEYLETKGIKMVVVPHFKRTYLDGAVLYGSDGAPIIALTLRYDRLDNFWFTLLHELSHLILSHLHGEGDNCILDDLDLHSSLDETEKQADETANDALIPKELWETHSAKRTARLAQVLDLARKAEVHPAVVAGRVRFEKGNYRLLSRQVGHGEVKKLFKA